MERVRSPGAVSALAITCLVGACASSPSPGDAPSADARGPRASETTPPAGGGTRDAAVTAEAVRAIRLPATLEGLDLGGKDWVLLGSGEWLRGEITLVQKEVLEFDSDELDDLKIDLEDVAELRSAGTVTCYLEGREQVSGLLHIRRDGVSIDTGEERLIIPRSRLLTVIRGEPTESNYWSGKLSLGVSLRRGNTDQADLTINGRLRRQTAATRLEAQYSGAFGELDGVQNVNNHRANGNFDVRLTRRFYLTPVFGEFYRDPFQNVEVRVTPGTGAGYTLVDTAKVDWDLGGGVGYQYSRFGAVAPGFDREDSRFALIVGTEGEVELTDDVDLRLEYRVSVPVPETEETNHHVQSVVSVELTEILDLDVTFTWDRIESPRPDAVGNVPVRDDFRLSVGLGVEF